MLKLINDVKNNSYFTHVRDLFSLRFEENFADRLGPVLPLLRDPSITDIHVNADGRVFTVTHGQGKQETDITLSETTTLQIIQLAASWQHKECHARTPRLSVVLPDGSRFQGAVPPVVEAPVFAIRKHAPIMFTLEDYVEARVLSPEQAAIVREAVGERKTMLICGDAGSGKTTFLTMLLSLVAESNDRVVIIEDEVPEVRCAAPDTVCLIAQPKVATVDDLLRDALRYHPTRIVVGEVRGKEVFALLKIWLSGHPGGMCTVHADDPMDALLRLELLAREAINIDVRLHITRAVDLVIHMARSRDGGSRSVQSLHRVEGLTKGQFKLKHLA